MAPGREVRRGYRLGVDLGTTFTAAAIETGGRAEVVPLGDHAPQIPSLVFVREDGELLVGEAAGRRGLAQPDRLAREFKRRLGDRVPFVLGGMRISAPELTARLLRSVYDEVLALRGGPPERLAITHPANWGPHRRDLLLQAVDQAGVGEVTLMTEPAAAAVYFASTERADAGDVVAVYDLGGGTFDAAVLRKTPTEFTLLGSPHGVEQLGGIDFDDAVFRHVLDAAGDALGGLDVEDAAVLAALARLRLDCTGAKEALGPDSDAAVQVALPGAAPVTVRIGRSEFEDMIRPSIEETVGCLMRAVASAGVGADDVRAVVLVGGSARIPLVGQMLGRELGRPVAVSPQPKLSVALGAALLAGGVLPAGPEEAPPGTPEPPPDPAPPSEVITIRPPRPPERPVAPPPAPRAAPVRWQPLGAVAALLVVAVALAFGAPLLSRRPTPSGWAVNDVRNVVGVDGVSVDLEKKFTLLPPPATPPPFGVQGHVLGIAVGDRKTVGGPKNGPGPPTVLVDLHELALVPGPVRLEVADLGPVLLLLPATPAPLRWAPPLVLALLVAGYTESVMRGVRRRRGALPADVATMAGVGAATGLALVLASWTLARNDVELWLVLAVPVVCAAAGALLTRFVGTLVRARTSRRP